MRAELMLIKGLLLLPGTGLGAQEKTDLPTVLLGMHVCVYAKSLQSSDSLRPNGLYPTSLLCPWDSLGKNTGVGCPALLQGIFTTPHPEIKPMSLMSLTEAGGFFTTSTTSRFAFKKLRCKALKKLAPDLENIK